MTNEEILKAVQNEKNDAFELFFQVLQTYMKESKIKRGKV